MSISSSFYSYFYPSFWLWLWLWFCFYLFWCYGSPLSSHRPRNSPLWRPWHGRSYSCADLHQHGKMLWFCGIGKTNSLSPSHKIELPLSFFTTPPSPKSPPLPLPSTFLMAPPSHAPSRWLPRPLLPTFLMAPHTPPGIEVPVCSIHDHGWLHPCPRPPS